MKCPNCGSRKAVQIDMHSEGFTSHELPVKECGDCGLVWRVRYAENGTAVDIIRPGNKKEE